MNKLNQSNITRTFLIILMTLVIFSMFNTFGVCAKTKATNVNSKTKVTSVSKKTKSTYAYLKFTNVKSGSIVVTHSVNGKGKHLSIIKSGKHKNCYKVKPGTYSYSINQKGYVKVIKAFQVDKKQVGKIVKMKANLIKLTNTGFQANVKYSFPSSIEDNLFCLKASYSKTVLNSPSFTTNKGKNLFTTDTQLLSYIGEKCSSSSLLYSFSNDLEMPIVVFTSTDIAGATSIEDALNVLQMDDKLNIYYQAQIHGDEPASCDGALAIMDTLCGTYGDEIKDNVNIVIIPRVNALGSKIFERFNGGIDLNRDNLTAISPITQYLQKLFDEYRPDVMIDAHEYSSPLAFDTTDFSKLESKGISLSDIKISAISSNNVDPLVKLDSLSIADSAFFTCQKAGLATREYGRTSNGSKGRAYYSMCDTNFVLIETMGKGMGKSHYKNRVIAQYIATKSVIDSCNSNSKTFKNHIRQARERLLMEMSNYDIGDPFTLKHGAAKLLPQSYTDFQYYLSGKVVKTLKVEYRGAESLETRKYPTAYIIPKNAPGAGEVVSSFTKRGIKYYEKTLENPIQVQVYEYGNDIYQLSNSETEENMDVYIIPTSQFYGRIIATLLEPDLGNVIGTNGSFVQQGIIDYSNIFRYIGDCSEII